MAGPKERRFHESTSRAFSQLAFLALGMLPLLACVFYCVLNATPAFHSWRLSQWENQLTRTLGVTVDIQKIETPTPIRTRLYGVRLRDRESHVSIASAATIEVERYRGQWLIQVFGASLEGPRFLAAWRDLHERFLCCPLDTYQEAHVVFDQLQLHGGVTKYTLEDASIKVARRSDSTRMLCEFRPKQTAESAAGLVSSSTVGSTRESGSSGGHSDSEVPSGEEPQSGKKSPVRVVLDRQHASEEPFTQMLVSATETPLPSPLAQLMWPGLDTLGPNARFRGTLQLDVKDHGWVARVGGQSENGKPIAGLNVEDVDFEALCWNAPSADVTGLGTLQLQQATITEQQIEYLLGDIRIEKGRVRGPFLEQLRIQLGVQLAGNLIGGHQDAAFEQARLMFEISADSSALRLVGGLPQGELPHGGVLQDSNALLAARSNAQEEIPLASLVRLLGESPLPKHSPQIIQASTGSSPNAEIVTSGALVNQPKLPARRASFIQRWLPIKSPVDTSPTSRTVDRDVSIHRSIR